MSTDLQTDNEELVRRAVQRIAVEGRYEEAPEYFSEDYVRHDPTKPDVPRGPDGFVEAVKSYVEAFSDPWIEIDHLVAEGDLVAFHAREGGRHTGPFMGIEPTDVDVTFEGNAMHRVEDGKITETWATWDVLGLLRRLEASTPRSDE